MSSQLALELLALSASLHQLNNFQILNLGQGNNVIALSPDGSGCDNTLAQVFSSGLNINALDLNLGGCNGCLAQLTDLQNLFISGLDNNNNNKNDKNDKNQTANVNEAANTNEDNAHEQNAEDQAKAIKEALKAKEEESAKNATDADNANGNDNENVDEKQDGKTPAEGTEGRKLKLKGKRSPEIVQRSEAMSMGNGRLKEKVVGSVVFGVVVFGLVWGL
ncbi:uncharacterized protein RAG0_13859 [Rhynchosporium agropyri]|uniref:Uncharacterized protein n=1 Tax=Rhynchosporium agropyri TaxID=914238 RepID=A0A1E1LEE9_9HELO|nr:uncharacterized protein RAG0_13859 [Rhynchosporium agropyri]